MLMLLVAGATKVEYQLLWIIIAIAIYSAIA